MTALRHYFLDRISLDMRALALFRIILSVYLLVELNAHGFVAQHVAGYLPVDLTLPWIRLLAGSAIFVSLVAFGLGYKTRWSACFLWLSYALFHMGPDADGYHALICAVLLQCVFLPTGRYFSLDDAMDRGAMSDGEHREADSSIKTIVSAAAVVFTLGYIAMFTAWASEFPLHSDRWHLVAGLLVIAAHLLPRSLDWLRLVSIAAFVVAMLNQGLSENVDSAAFERGLLIVLAILLVPSWFFTTISSLNVFSSRHDLRIYYDEPCGFCRKICYIFASFLLLGNCRIATAQSDEVAHKLLRDNDSWVVFDGDDQYELCWAALLKLMRVSPVWAPLGWVLTLIGMGTWGKPLYRLIGSIRNVLSKLTATLLPYSPYRLELRVYEKVTIAIWASLMLVHYSGVGASLYGSVPDVLAIVGFSETR